MNKTIDSFLVRKDANIKDTMKIINKAGLGIVLVVDKDRHLVGVVTDGDIRRALLKGKDFNSPINKIMTTNPLVASESVTAAELLQLCLNKGVNQIPILDKDNRVLDIVLLSELKHIPLSAPDITHKEIEIVNKVLTTPYLSIGPKIKEFEEKIASFIGTRYAIAVNSGTSALHLCIRSLGIKDGDEVITSPFSFIASANCILFERGKPVFVDIDESTLCIDVNKIEEKISSRTKAILPVHIFGHPCKMDKIMEIARRHNLAVIEDTCEAIGTEFKGKKVGSLGTLGVFGFYPNKQITTAEGGMVVTNVKNLARLCQSLRNQGRDENNEDWLSHKRLGYNYRMSELSAALGLAQIGRIEEILKKRQHIAELYNRRLEKVKGITILYVAPEVKMSWFVYVIRLDTKCFSKDDRDEITRRLGLKGIECGEYFSPIHLQPFYVEMYGYKKGSFPITEMVAQYTIALPFYNNLKEEEIDYICDTIKKVIREFKGA